MSVVLAFYAVALLVVLGIALGVYLLVARRNRWLAAGLAGLTLTGLMLLWPIPIHGGFMLLGETLYRRPMEPLPALQGIGLRAARPRSIRAAAMGMRAPAPGNRRAPGWWRASLR